MVTSLNLTDELRSLEVTSPIPAVVEVRELYTPGDPGSRALITFEDGTEVAAHEAARTGGEPSPFKIPTRLCFKLGDS